MTGASNGIGRVIAQTLAQADANVTVFDMAEQPRDGGTPTAERIVSSGGEATFVQVDVTDPDSVREAVDTAEGTYGPVSLLVNNAGINHLGSVADISIEDWDETIKVNLRGVFLTCRFCINSLIETKGSIVNIASGAGLHGSPDYAAYGPSKAGVLNLTKQLATDYSPEGVRVNAIAPGVIDAGMANQELEDEEVRQRKTDNILLDRFGTPQDVANGVAFLSSDAASFITGETMVIDGGWDA